ncbi:MOSC domain-containing protein [Jeotgalibacillus proteolyticus]|uniref:MOSC domain-containing protein n=1 Tax=Jeotgalibacillus proteolyticus TaxID=2082395 RepID=UPI003CF9ACDB
MEGTVYQVHSLNAGKTETLTFGSKTFDSAIRKRPVNRRVWVHKLGIEEDEQAYKDHGGTEKAICQYPYEYYGYWKDLLGFLETEALFGENLSTIGLTEENTHIGDIFALGEARLQVTEPRQPCYKLAAKYNIPDLVARMQKSGYTGFMFRVLEEGWVSPGDELILISQDEKRVTVAEVNRVKWNKKASAEEVEEILSVEALSKTLRETLSKRRKM